MKKIKVAAAQQKPFFFDCEKTLDLVAKDVKCAADQDVDLILFPESFLPGYPRGMTFGAVVGSRSPEGRKLWQLYSQNSIKIGDAIYQRLSEIARESGLILAIGVTEKDAINSSLYCSLLVFNADGELMLHHRKIKPTGTERVIWAEGDGQSLKTVESRMGRIGGLICWENMMPEARISLYRAGIDLYLAPTADARDSWTSSMQHIACESRCYLVSANQYFKKSDYPVDLEKYLMDDLPEDICRGGSVIVSPYGQLLAGPLFDQTGLLIAEIDLGEITRSRMDFDSVGHYSRPDLFTFQMRRDG